MPNPTPEQGEPKKPLAKSRLIGDVAEAREWLASIGREPTVAADDLPSVPKKPILPSDTRTPRA